MSKIKNDTRYCPLLKKICIETDCGWYMQKLDTCAIQVIPYNLFKHGDRLNQCNKNLHSILNYISERQ